MHIYHYPDPVLSKISKPVDNINKAFVKFIHEMINLMIDKKGVGLAAPQVGINKRFFIVSPTGGREDAELYINPEIMSHQGEMSSKEGCLSLPGVVTTLKRSREIVVTYVNLNLENPEPIDVNDEKNMVTVVATNLESTIIQHEIDHLDGLTLAHKMNSIDKICNTRSLKKLKATYKASHS